MPRQRKEKKMKGGPESFCCFHSCCIIKLPKHQRFFKKHIGGAYRRIEFPTHCIKFILRYVGSIFLQLGPLLRWMSRVRSRQPALGQWFFCEFRNVFPALLHALNTAITKQWHRENYSTLEIFIHRCIKFFFLLFFFFQSE